MSHRPHVELHQQLVGRDDINRGVLTCVCVCVCVGGDIHTTHHMHTPLATQCLYYLKFAWTGNVCLLTKPGWGDQIQHINIEQGRDEEDNQGRY